jgi:hypothetical protein
MPNGAGLLEGSTLPSVDLADFGFEYVEALCESVEEITRAAVEQRSDAFDYRGANLRYAVERDLYFSLINNAAIKRQYALHRAAGPEAAPRNGRSMGEFVCHFDHGGHLQLRHRPSSLTLLRRLMGRTANRFRPKARRSPLGKRLQGTAPNLGQASLFVLVHSEKFVRYLQPITTRFGSDEVVWLSSSEMLSHHLLAEGLPHVPLESWTGRFYGRASGSLRHAISPGYHYMLAQYDAFQQLLTIHRPRCLLLAEGNAPADEVGNQAATVAGVPTVCIQQGWCPFVHSGFRNMSYTRMLMWGEGFAELLAPFNPRQRFAITGSHIADGSRGTSTPAWLRERTANKTVVSFFLQSASAIISQRGWTEFLMLLEATARAWPDALIIAREHPNFPLTEPELKRLGQLPNVELAPSARCSLADLLAVSHVSASIYSTTILESIAFGVPPLIYNCTSMPRFSPDVDALGAGIEVRGLEIAIREIGRLIDDESYRESFRPSMERFTNRFFYAADGQSCSRIVSEIRSVM